MRRLGIFIGCLIFLLPAARGQDLYVSERKLSRDNYEIAPAFYEEDGKQYLVFMARQRSKGAKSPTDPEGRNLYTLYYREFKNGKWGRAELFREELNKKGRGHLGPASFTADFQTMVFSQQRRARGTQVDPLGIYFSQKNSAGNWGPEYPFEYNETEVWFFSPSISPDGNTLFFAANYPDGLGGYDIYVSRLEGGTWSKPENLGPAVNSPGNELYPVIHSSGRLYFSTDGRGRRANKYDLYVSTMVRGEWVEAAALEEFNTINNDYYILFDDQFRSFFKTSGNTKGLRPYYIDVPELKNEAKEFKKTYFKYRIYDRKLKSVNPDLFIYSWTINDTLQIPGHDIIVQFPDTGTYHCSLNVYDIELDTLLEGQTQQVLRIQHPVQAVISGPDTVQVNTEVTFHARRSHLPGFSAGRYLWDFGGENFREGEEVTFSFTEAGEHTIFLGVEEEMERSRGVSRRTNNERIPELYAIRKTITVLDSSN